MASEVSDYYKSSNEEVVATKWWYLLITLGVVTILVWMAVFSLKPKYQLRVSIYDIGQGDSIFVESYHGSQVLIDGGPDNTILSKLGRDMPFYDRTIDLVILTHPHADHVSGLVEVLRRYQVKHILFTNVDYNTQVYQTFRKQIAELDIPATVARAGQQIYLDDATIISVVHPLASLAEKTIKDVNESSVVSRLSFGKIDFLLTGDASVANESAIIAGGYAIDAEVLKVGHQGSRTSTDPQFLQAVSPDFAVISVGEDNRYGHPHEEVVNRLEESGLTLLRTDQSGDVLFISDGENLTLAD